MSNIGAIAIGVLVVAADRQPVFVDGDFGQGATFSKATKQSRRFIRAFRKATRLQEIAALTRRLQGQPAGAGL